MLGRCVVAADALKEATTVLVVFDVGVPSYTDRSVPPSVKANANAITTMGESSQE